MFVLWSLHYKETLISDSQMTPEGYLNVFGINNMYVMERCSDQIFLKMQELWQ